MSEQYKVADQLIREFIKKKNESKPSFALRQVKEAILAARDADLSLKEVTRLLNEGGLNVAIKDVSLFFEEEFKESFSKVLPKKTSKRGKRISEKVLE